MDASRPREGPHRFTDSTPSGAEDTYRYNEWASNNNTSLLNTTFTGNSSGFLQQQPSPTPMRVAAGEGIGASLRGYGYGDWRQRLEPSSGSGSRRGVTITGRDPNVYSGGTGDGAPHSYEWASSRPDAPPLHSAWRTTDVGRNTRYSWHLPPPAGGYHDTGLVNSQPRLPRWRKSSSAPGTRPFTSLEKKGEEDAADSRSRGSWICREQCTQSYSSCTEDGVTQSSQDGSCSASNGIGVHDSAATVASVEAAQIDLDAAPVVPVALLQRTPQLPFQWNRHVSHPIVLLLLQQRGICLPRYRELIDYHMAELFLHYLDMCREGSYFVHYAPNRWPKERFFSVQLMPMDRLAMNSEPVPHLVRRVHRSGVHIEDAIPLQHLVGVTASPQSPCFRPFLESPNTIAACREGRGHRARLPVDGCFSLWFYDKRRSVARSVDLLTCDAKVFDIWTKTFMGLVSVCGSSVVQTSLTKYGQSVNLMKLTNAAMQQCKQNVKVRQG